MKNLKSKLRSKRGETLVETLIAMLVVSLSSVLLATMLSTGASLNGKAIEQSAKLYQQLTVAETAATGTSIGDPKLRIRYGTQSTEVDVKLYGMVDGLLSYAKEGVSP